MNYASAAGASPRRLTRAAAAGWLAVIGLIILNVFTATWYLLSTAQPHSGAPATQHQSCPPPPCLDALILYHPDDKQMFITNGGLDSAMTNIVGIRTFFILSASNSTFSRYLQPREASKDGAPRLPDVRWIDEKRAPFSRKDFEGCKRPAGWLFQQSLKFWALSRVPELCPNVMILDSDLLWMRKFDPRASAPRLHVPYPDDEAPVSEKELGEDGKPLARTRPEYNPSEEQAMHTCPPAVQRWKYCVSSMDSGAWYGDITNGEYHHFVNWFLGQPKELANTHTGINNWQVMQRDVVLRIEASLQDRGYKNFFEAIQYYGKHFNGMSEYEAYFSYVYAHYKERIEMVYLPWILRNPKTCNFHDQALRTQFEKTSVVYFTCHDNYGFDDYYINCKGRERQCDPKLAG